MKNKKQLISLVQKDNKNTIKLYSLLLFFCFTDHIIDCIK